MYKSHKYVHTQLKLINSIPPTPHPRVELPLLKFQNASLGLKVACNTETFYGGHEERPSLGTCLQPSIADSPALSAFAPPAAPAPGCKRQSPPAGDAPG